MKQTHQQSVDKPLLLRCVVLTGMVIAAIPCIVPPVAFTDDTFAQYMLGGGFPAARTQVTYFEYSFLFYESFFAWLYRCFPGFNIMTAFYLLLHGVCAVIITYTLLRHAKGPAWTARILLAGYLLLFVAPFLINLSYTSVAGHCIATALFVYALYMMRQKKPGWKASMLLLLLMLLGAGLRVHILLPLLACSAPLVLLLRQRATQKRFALWCSLLGTALAACILLHQQDYKQNIAGWQHIKTTMDAAFYLSNHGGPDIATEMIRDKDLPHRLGLSGSAVFGEDRARCNDAPAGRYHKQAVYTGRSVEERVRHVQQAFTVVRKPLIFLSLCILLLVTAPVTIRQKLMVLSAAGISIGILLYMSCYLKAPERVSRPLVLMAFLLCAAALISGGRLFSLRYKWPVCTACLMLIILQGISFYHLRKDNQALIARFVRNVNFLQQHKDTLFIELAPGGFALDGFPALHPPGKYPLENICLDFFFNTELRYNTLRHFGYKDMQEAILYGRNVMTVGEVPRESGRYIYKKEKVPVECTQFKDAPDDLMLTIPARNHLLSDAL